MRANYVGIAIQGLRIWGQHLQQESLFYEDSTLINCITICRVINPGVTLYYMHAHWPHTYVCAFT